MWSRLNCSLQMSSKPPLCAGVGLLCTAELGADYHIVAKVVFTWHRTSSWIKLTASERTVNIQEIIIISLPNTCGEMDANVSTNVDVFHFLAMTLSSVIYLNYYMKFWRHFNLANLAIFQEIAKLKCTKIKCR